MRLIEAFQHEDTDVPSIPVIYSAGEQMSDGGLVSYVLVRKVHGEFVLEPVDNDSTNQNALNLPDLQAHFRLHGTLPELISAKGHRYVEEQIGRSELDLPNGDTMPFVAVKIKWVERVKRGRSRFDSPDWQPETK